MSLADSSEPDAGGKLTKALADPHWYIRGHAAIALGRRGEKSALPGLFGLLESDHWFVRDCVIEALGAMSDPSAAARLVPMLGAPDPYVRSRVAIALGRIRNASAAQTLIELLRDEEDQVKRSAAAALGELNAREAVEPLLKLAAEGSAPVRVAAADALGKIREQRAAPVLESTIKDLGEDGTADAWMVAAALHRLGNRDYLPKITAALKSEFAETRKSAFSTLIELADSRALAAMLEALRARENDSDLRLALARGLARFDGEQARAASIALLDDRDPQVRAAAVTSLGAVARFSPGSESENVSIQALARLLKNERVEVVITAINAALASLDRSRVADALLSSPDGAANPNVSAALSGMGVTVEKLREQASSGALSDRLRAAEMMGRLGDPQAVPALIQMLMPENERQLRAKAAGVLGSLKDRRAAEPLIAAARTPEREVRLAAVIALGKLGDYSASDTLFEAAGDKDEAVRAAALDALAGLGVTVDRLTADLAASNWQVRAAALTSLARLGDSIAVPAAITGLKDRDPRVRVEAVRAVAVLAPRGDRGALEAIIAVLGDSNPDVRMQSAVALGQFNDARAVAPLTGLLGDRDSQVSLAAAESLARMQDPRVIRLLVDSLDSADWRIRARSAQVLAQAPRAAAMAGAVALLADAIRDKDLIVRYYAAEALVAIGQEAVPRLIEMLKSDRRQERGRVARILARIGQPAIMPLIGFLEDRNIASESKVEAVRLLGRLGDGRAVDPMIALLRDERYYIRQEVSQALGQIGEPALDRLVELAGSQAPATRAAAIEALGAVNSPRAMDLVITALDDPAPGVRIAAVRALGETGSEAVVPTLMSLMRDESSALRAQAAASLARLGKPALSGLVEALRDAKPSVRVLAAQALGEIAAREAVPALVELINADLSGARGEAIEALGKIGDPSAVGPILTALEGGSVAVRRKAIAALARLRDQRAVAPLVRALSDRDVEVRQAAAAALAELADGSIIAKLEGVAENDPSADVRGAAARAVERIRARGSGGDPQTKPAKSP